MMELRDFKRQFEEFIDQTDENRRLAERDRDFIDLKHWTDAEKAVLRANKQDAVVVPKIKKKHNFLLGLEIRGRTDPKAFPRTPQHDQDADAMTDALRYVEENSGLDTKISACADEYFCEGEQAMIIEVSGPKKEIKPRRIPWDRHYYDVHSRERDRSDKKYDGITVWIDREDLKRMFPDKEDKIGGSGDNFASLDESFEDRPRWFDRVSGKRNRVRFNEHYFLEDGEWKLVFFTGDTILEGPKLSPFLDDEGNPICPIESQVCYMDRENNVYGVTRGDISLQIEINKRRSKYQHMLSSQIVTSEKGMVDSSSRMMAQLKTGDAHIELNKDGRFEIDRNQELSSGQLSLYQDAKNELDDSIATAVTPASGESGRSKLVDRENDLDELATVFEGHRDFKLRIYRQVWWRVRQFWSEERWIRVTDDEQNVKFVGLNRQVTGRDMVAERFGIQSGEVEQFLIQEGIGLIPGQLERVVKTENQVAEIDVDIIIDEIPDTVSLRHEQFQILAGLAEKYGPEEVPFDVMLELSGYPKKAALIERIKGDENQQQEAAQQAQQLQVQQFQQEQMSQQADDATKLARARKDNAQADQTLTETDLAKAGVEKIG